MQAVWLLLLLMPLPLLVVSCCVWLWYLFYLLFYLHFLVEDTCAKAHVYRRTIKLDDCLDPHCMYNTCMRAHNTDDVYRKCHGNVWCSPQAHQVCLLKGFAAFLCHTLRTLASEVRYGICARTYSIPVLFLWPMCIPWHEVWAIDACSGQLALVCKLRRSSQLLLIVDIAYAY